MELRYRATLLNWQGETETVGSGSYKSFETASTGCTRRLRQQDDEAEIEWVTQVGDIWHSIVIPYVGEFRIVRVDA